MSSSERFGYEWDRYSFMDKNYEEQFRNWTSPLSEKDFEGRAVLDAGCGMGRNSYWPLKWGAREVVSFDLDERSVSRAKETLREFKNSEILLRSIYDINWHDKFDIALSIGVVHHLKEPKIALQNMVRSLRGGGTLLIWVYSYEGNEWIPKYVNPIRKNITSKLPVRIVHFLSYFCSIPLWIYIKIAKRKTGYLKQLSYFDFWHIHSIVFDQLIPEVANYWAKGDVEKLFSDLGLEDVSINTPPNGNGWTVIAKKK
jgi:SAM-dependent methyltransferase